MDSYIGLVFFFIFTTGIAMGIFLMVILLLFLSKVDEQ